MFLIKFFNFSSELIFYIQPLRFNITRVEVCRDETKNDLGQSGHSWLDLPSERSNFLSNQASLVCCGPPNKSDQFKPARPVHTSSQESVQISGGISFEQDQWG